MSRGLGRVEKAIIDRLSKAEGNVTTLYALVDVSKDSRYKDRVKAYKGEGHPYRSYHDGFPARCYYGNYDEVKRAARSLERKRLVKSWMNREGHKVVQLRVPSTSSGHIPEQVREPEVLTRRGIRETAERLAKEYGGRKVRGDGIANP